MLARKSHRKGKECPQEWIDQISHLINDLYATLFEKEGKKFTVYGYIYSDELLLIVCLSKKDSLDIVPLSLFISADCENEEEQILKHILDFLGILLEHILSKIQLESYTEEIYLVSWQEYEYNRQKYYYKITREDINATLEANRLLDE